MTIENRDWANWQYTMRDDRGGAARRRRRAARAGDAAAARPRRPRRRSRSTDARRSARHPRARQRARDRRAGRRRRPRAPAARARRHPASTSHVFTIGSATAAGRDARRLSTAPARCPTTRRCAASIRTLERADDRGDRSRARGRRHARRRVRGHRHRRAGRPRQLRAVGPQARWPARAGADVDPGDQGRRHRPRPGGGDPARARACTTRSCPRRRGARHRRRAPDQQRRRPRGRRHQRRGPARLRPA